MQLNSELEIRVQKRTKELLLVNKQLTAEAVERRIAQDSLKHQALHDALTDLPNRYALKEILEHEIARANRHGYQGAILFLDLDNFKIINDSLGHETGDLVLKTVAERLDKCRRGEDFLGRLGGDEFVFVLTQFGNEGHDTTNDLQVMVERIANAMADSIKLGALEFDITTSIGIKLFPESHEESPEDLLREADTALYDAKKKGHGHVSFFQHTMQEEVKHRLQLAGELREALKQKQMLLYYQPIVNRQGGVIGLEALLRWSHPARGMVGPDEFIPLAEKIGIIDELDRYVLRHACTETRECREKGGSGRPIKIAVNISPKHFIQPDFVKQIEEHLSIGGEYRNNLVLEITEGVMINDFENISHKMYELNHLGVQFSLDDFGTGYSSLAYLKRLPLNTLKIDRSFVRDIDTNKNDAAIIKSILAMAATLEIDVVAEGVETSSQHEFLKQQGCGLFQGYQFGRPAPIDDLVKAGLIGRPH